MRWRNTCAFNFEKQLMSHDMKESPAPDRPREAVNKKETHRLMKNMNYLRFNLYTKSSTAAW